MLHPGFERELGRDRAERARAEVARNRLEARLRRAEDGSDAHRGEAAGGLAFFAALFRRIVPGF